jgi:hypothetical protein
MSTLIFRGTEETCRQLVAKSKLPIPLHDANGDKIGEVCFLYVDRRRKLPPLEGYEWGVYADVTFDHGKIADHIWHGKKGYEADL